MFSSVRWMPGVHRITLGVFESNSRAIALYKSAYVQTIEKRAGVKIGCPEEAAFRAGFLKLPQLEQLAATMPKCEYRDYLEKEVIAEARRMAAHNA